MSLYDLLIAKVSELALSMSSSLNTRGFKRGGSAGQMPVKLSNEDFDWDWADPATVSLTWSEIADKPAWTGTFDGSYSSLSGKPTLGDASALNVGTTAGTVAAGNHTHSGVYQPVISSYSVISGLSGYPATFPPIIGSGAGDAVAGNDARLTNARTPTAHKSSHAIGGSDPLTPSDIGAQPAGSYAAASHTHTSADITDATDDTTAQPGKVLRSSGSGALSLSALNATSLSAGSVSISSLSLTTALSIANGGTGATTVDGARSALGAVGLTGNETIAGNKTLTGQLELSASQAETNPTSAMTRALGDARYGGPHYLLVLTTQISSASTAYVDSAESLSLPAGTYRFMSNVAMTTASTTSGIQGGFKSSSNTAAPTASTRISGVFTSADGVATSGIWRRVGVQSFDTLNEAWADGSATVRWANATANGIVTFAAGATITPRIKQRTITDASNPAIMEVGSYITFIKIA